MRKGFGDIVPMASPQGIPSEFAGAFSTAATGSPNATPTTIAGPVPPDPTAGFDGAAFQEYLAALTGGHYPSGTNFPGGQSPDAPAFQGIPGHGNGPGRGNGHGRGDQYGNGHGNGQPGYRNGQPQRLGPGAHVIGPVPQSWPSDMTFPDPNGNGYGPYGAAAPLLVVQPPYGVSPSFPGANPFAPQPLVPDRYLPPALKRIPPAVGPWYRPNQYDRALLREAYAWKWIGEHGGLKSCCRIPELGSPIWSQPPWQVKPSSGQDLNVMVSQPVAAFQSGGVFTGVDVVIGTFRVPIGWDGVVNRFVAGTVGVSGFDDFSGNIIWRLQIGSRFVKGLGKVLNTYGSFQNAVVVPGSNLARAISGQTITLIANVPASSTISGGVITAGIFGWIYPRR